MKISAEYVSQTGEYRIINKPDAPSRFKLVMTESKVVVSKYTGGYVEDFYAYVRLTIPTRTYLQGDAALARQLPFLFEHEG